MQDLSGGDHVETECYCTGIVILNMRRGELADDYYYDLLKSFYNIYTRLSLIELFEIFIMTLYR